MISIGRNSIISICLAGLIMVWKTIHCTLLTEFLLHEMLVRIIIIQKRITSLIIHIHLYIPIYEEWVCKYEIQKLKRVCMSLFFCLTFVLLQRYTNPCSIVFS